LLKEVADSTVLYIGIEPSDNIIEGSKKALRRKISNVLFIQSSIEEIMDSKVFMNIAFSNIKIYLPWSGLLKLCVEWPEDFLDFITSKTNNFELVLGYDEASEQTLFNDYSLPHNLEAHFKDSIIDKFKNLGYKCEFKKLSAPELYAIDSTWAKRIHTNQDRDVFLFRAVK
jgi:hypothetical protein